MGTITRTELKERKVIAKNLDKIRGFGLDADATMRDVGAILYELQSEAKGEGHYQLAYALQLCREKLHKVREDSPTAWPTIWPEHLL